MNKTFTKIMALSLAATMLCGNLVYADGVVENPYLSLGADLKSSEKAVVLELLGVKEDQLDHYKVVQITNQDEHDYLDAYLNKSIIGTRALSSVLIEKQQEGHGIKVVTKNISYCTEGMYQNALITAGVTDADVVVAGPFEITGTAALVGAMKAYEAMTGEDISEENKDAATEELVITGDIADSIDDSKKAEDFIAKIKDEIIDKGLKDDDSIEGVIDRTSNELQIKLTEEQKEQLRELMKKISNLDLNVEIIRKQASEIYNRIKDLNIDTQSIFDRIMNIFNALFSALERLIG